MCLNKAQVDARCLMRGGNSALQGMWKYLRAAQLIWKNKRHNSSELHSGKEIIQRSDLSGASTVPKYSPDKRRRLRAGVNRVNRSTWTPSLISAPIGSVCW